MKNYPYRYLLVFVSLILIALASALASKFALTHHELIMVLIGTAIASIIWARSIIVALPPRIKCEKVFFCSISSLAAILYHPILWSYMLYSGRGFSDELLKPFFSVQLISIIMCSILIPKWKSISKYGFAIITALLADLCIIFCIILITFSPSPAAKSRKPLSAHKHIKNLPNGGRIITTVTYYRASGLTGSGHRGTNLYEYIPPDSNISEFFGESWFDAGNWGITTTEWISQNEIFIATGHMLFLRLKDSTGHKFNFVSTNFPGRDTDLGKSLLSLHPNCGGYFQVINVGDENAWVPDFLVGSSILLEEKGMLFDNGETTFYIFVSYHDAKGSRTLKYRLDLTKMQLTLVEVRPEKPRSVKYGSKRQEKALRRNMRASERRSGRGTKR